MKPKLTRFEGEQIQGAQLRIAGKIAERVGQLAKGEVVYFVGCGTVDEVGFKDVKGAPTRRHVVQTTALVLIERKDGERMLTEGAMLADDRFGVQTLFTGDDDPPTEP